LFAASLWQQCVQQRRTLASAVPTTADDSVPASPADLTELRTTSDPFLPGNVQAGNSQ